jgi:hypothetical protein
MLGKNIHPLDVMKQIPPDKNNFTH